MATGRRMGKSADGSGQAGDGQENVPCTNGNNVAKQLELTATKKGNRDTEKRRLQNRNAQRSNQKLKLRELEERLQSLNSDSAPSLILSTSPAALPSVPALADTMARDHVDAENGAMSATASPIDLDIRFAELEQFSTISPDTNYDQLNTLLSQLTSLSASEIPSEFESGLSWIGGLKFDVIDPQRLLRSKNVNMNDTIQQAVTGNFRPNLSQCSTPSSRMSSATTTFLYSNHIRLQDMTFLAAVLANAASLGISRDDYLQDKLSPFFITDGRGFAISSVKDFQDVKPHLRPLAIQTSLPHASYLDLIIFPRFRENAMLHATANPSLLDQEALFTDMLSGGLTCWGSFTGENGRGSGVPWDMRSWEAKPWFLKKWWFLVGEKDGEMWETSKWWWQIRGDVLDDDTPME